jgi:hypothetical protein
MLETIDFFFFSPTRLGIARAVSHKSRHESHCGLQKTSLYLHESGPRVNKHLGEFNDFSTICGKSDPFVNPYFSTLFCDRRGLPEECRKLVSVY